MKTIEMESVEKMSSLDLSYLIFFWKEYDPNSVQTAYAELVKRDCPILGNFYDKMTDFRKKQFLLDNQQEL